MAELTVREIRLLHAGNQAVEVMLDWSLRQAAGDHTYNDFLTLVDKGLTYAISVLGENPKDAIKRTENDLTRELCCHMRGMGFQVEFDSTVGGHCDMVVRHGTTYMWLAEAKIYSSYEWLFKGYLQLLTRYSTGAINQDCGGLIIYVKDGDLVRIMDTWAERLASRRAKPRRGEIQVQRVTPPACAMSSEQTHPRTGRPYTVKHYPVALQWAPE